MRQTSCQHTILEMKNEKRHEQLKGKKCQRETVEFGEQVHFRHNLEATPKDEKLGEKWSEGFFFGKWWRGAQERR